MKIWADRIRDQRLGRDFVTDEQETSEKLQVIDIASREEGMNRRTETRGTDRQDGKTLGKEIYIYPSVTSTAETCIRPEPRQEVDRNPACAKGRELLAPNDM